MEQLTLAAADKNNIARLAKRVHQIKRPVKYFNSTFEIIYLYREKGHEATLKDCAVTSSNKSLLQIIKEYAQYSSPSF
ncbi:hypothetical protein ACFFJN_00580 [Erwinia mallotivora]|uniref:hypothetical protein n=1 Tax=Erwinia mallotivora TaxID=69222 RepID=UPI0035EE615E